MIDGEASTSTRQTASASAAHGAPWLLAYGTTLAVTAVIAFSVSVEVAAAATLLQGGVALPLAFFLERVLGSGPLDKAHPLATLIVQMAMVQILALPAVLLMYDANPVHVPATFAAIAGGHFLPYMWLHRTRLYLALGLAVSLGSALLAVSIDGRSDRAVLVWWSACYFVAAPLLLRLDRQRRSATAAAQ